MVKKIIVYAITRYIAIKIQAVKIYISIKIDAYTVTSK